jgi:hypothetical protein
MEKVVIGIVDTPEQAAAAVERLQAMDIPQSEISVLFPDRRGNHDFAFEPSSKWTEGALLAAAIGFVVGAAVGAAMGLGLVAVPALGMLTAAGPVVSALSGAAVGALVFGLVGMLVGLGIPEILAKHYAGKVSAGGILVGVHVDNSESVRRTRDVLRSVEASGVKTTGEAALPAGARA